MSRRSTIAETELLGAGKFAAVAAVRLGNVAQYLLDVLTAALVGGLVTFVTENLDAHTP